MNLTESFNKNQQVSPELLKLLYNVQIQPTNPYQQVVAILIILKALTDLAWVEHTSDWDLGATIELKDGTIIEIPQGYAEDLIISSPTNKEIMLNFNEVTYNHFSHEEDTKDFILSLPDYEHNDFDESIEIIPINIHQIKSIHIYD